MNKLIYLILIISVLLISGCVDNDNELSILSIEKIDNTKIPIYEIIFLNDYGTIKQITTNDTNDEYLIYHKISYDNEYHLFSTLKFTMYYYDLYIPLNDLQIKNNT